MSERNGEERAREYRASTLEHRTNLVNKDFDIAASQTGQIFTLASAGVGLATTIGATTSLGRWCLVAAAICFVVAIGLSLHALTLGRDEIRNRISELDGKLANPELALGAAELRTQVAESSDWRSKWTRTRRVNICSHFAFGAGALFVLCSRILETVYGK